MEPSIILTMTGGLVVLGALAVVVLRKKRTAYLGPVKEELQKEKLWLRRGEHNAAMVKGRQNLELLLKLVAENNGIQLDNTAQAVANAREEEERRNQKGRKNHYGHGKTRTVMTHQQFNRWLFENGYLDRVARWEMNQVRLIGNKAVHENYADKDAAWNQYNYLEDILKTVTEHSQNPKKHHERAHAETPSKEWKERNPKRNETSGAEANDGKKKRRRRRRKPQGTANELKIVNEPKKKSEPKKANEKTTVKSGETPSTAKAQDEGPKSKPRRRRKPQNAANTVKATENAVKTEQNVPKAKRAPKPQDTPKAEKKVKAQNVQKPQKDAAKAQNVPKPQKDAAKPQNASKTQKHTQTRPQAQNPETPVGEAAEVKKKRRRRRPRAKANGEHAGGTVVTENKNESH